MAAPVYEAFIGGVDRAASHVLLEGFSLKEVTNGIDTGVFHVESEDASLRPTKRQEVLITENSIPIFGGFIRSARESAFGGISADGHDHIVTEIECDHFSQYFAREFITMSFAGGTLKSFAIAFTTFFAAAPFSITLDAGQVDGPTLPAIEFEVERGDDALNFVAALTAKSGAPFQWKMNHSKVWGFYQASADPAPWNLIEADFADGNESSTGDVIVEPTDDTYANRIYVVWGSGKVIDLGPDGLNTPEVFTGDGVTNVFPLKYQLLGPYPPPPLTSPRTFAAIGYGYVTHPNGTIGFLGNTGTFGAEWEYDQVTNSISRVAGPPPLGFVFTVGYRGEAQGIEVAEDAAEIAANGVWADKIVDDSIEDPALALEVAEAELARRLIQAKIVKWQTRRVPAPRPGESITATVPKRNLSGSFTVVDVTTDYEEGSDYLLRTVTLTTSVYEHWRQTLTRWWSPNLGGGPGMAPAGANATPDWPLNSVQVNDQWKFGGARHVLYGPLFWDQPDAFLGEVKNEGLVFNAGSALYTGGSPFFQPGGWGDPGHIGLDDPFRLEMGMLGSGDFSMDLFSQSSASPPFRYQSSILINSVGDIFLTAATPVVPGYDGGIFLQGHGLPDGGPFADPPTSPVGVGLSGGDVGQGYISFDGLYIFEGTAGGYRTVNSLPFSIQVTGNETTIERTTYVVTAGTGTIFLPWIGSAGVPNQRSFPSTAVGRIYWIINDGGGTLTVDAGTAGTNINDADSVTMADKAAIGVQRHDDGWRIKAAFGNVTGGGSSTATPGGNDKDVQFNDGGVLGGEDAFEWDKTINQLQLNRNSGNDTTFKVRDLFGLSGMIGLMSFGNIDYADISMGWERVSGVDTARADHPAYFYWNGGLGGSPPTGGAIGMEIVQSETPGSAMAFSLGRGFDVASNGIANLYQYGGLGTGAVSGMGLEIDANLDGNGSASYVSLQTRTGTRYYVWFDDSGIPRYSTAPPQEDGTPSDTSGTLFGTASPPFTLLTSDPGSPTDDTWWMVRENTSPMTVSLKARINGVTETIVSLTL